MRSSWTKIKPFKFLKSYIFFNSEATGFEPATFGVTDQRANQLRHTTHSVIYSKRIMRIELM